MPVPVSSPAGLASGAVISVSSEALALGLALAEHRPGQKFSDIFCSSSFSVSYIAPPSPVAAFVFVSLEFVQFNVTWKRKHRKLELLVVVGMVEHSMEN